MTGLTDDVSSEWSARVDQRFEDKLLSDAESTQGALEHPNWTLDNLDTREKETGMRLAPNNFQRKLYASAANMTETMENMVNMKIDVLIGTEPGLASLYNEALLKKTARAYGFDVKLIFRNRTDPHGGIVVIMGQMWSKIPSVVRSYDPLDPNLEGRLLSIEFNNKKAGQHNKVQIIGAHLINAAHTQLEDAKKLLTWIMNEKDRFSSENPQATSARIGDLNASESDYQFPLPNQDWRL